MARWLVWFVWLVGVGLLAAAPTAQVVPLPDTLRADTTKTDTARVRAPFRLATDTLRAGGRALVPAPAAEGGLEQPVTWTARDSLRIVLADRDTLDEGERPDDRAFLVGDVVVRYEDAEVRAGRMELLFGERLVRAEGLPADTGLVGRPAFAQGEESFTGRTFTYNFETRRGRVVGARTAVEQGFLLGGVVKQADAHTIYAADVAYTTCDLEHPHYALQAGRMKIVDNEYIYSGPVQLRLLGLPTPLWLPFGFFPAKEGRRSGPLPLQYGEDALGFYLRNVGYYWAVSDYFDAQLRAQVWTSGSYALNPTFRYRRRYAYTGQLDLGYARARRGERTDPDFTVQTDLQLAWRHEQEFSPTRRLAADVNLISRGFLRDLSDEFEDRITQTTTSSIAYRQSWPRGGRSLALNLRANQNLTSGAADLTLPSLTASQSTRFPLRRRVRSGQPRWYEQIGISYTGTLTNTYAFAPLPDTTLAGTPFADVSWVDALFDQQQYEGATGRTDRFRPEVTHAIPIGATFSMTRLLGRPFRLNWSPSVRYTESWYARSERRALDDSTGRIVSFQEPGFTAIRRLNASVSANTEFYGLFPLRIGPVRALRHVVRPTAALTYEPNYDAPPFDYYRTVTDTSGREIVYPIAGGLPGTPGERLALAWSLGNVFQGRKVRVDTTGEEQRSVVQLLTVNVRSAYDFAAPLRPLGDVFLDAATEHRRIRARFDAVFSPYAADSLGNPTPSTYLSQSGRLLRLTRTNLSVGATFSARPRGPA
ncbi:MAG TPA: putative LPS assembly protein LptD, partial [Rubricoccaceae bacterium]|nr:putative LPS assembly protein LptD [Rubricoccaceae bacterium]